MLTGVEMCPWTVNFGYQATLVSVWAQIRYLFKWEPTLLGPSLSWTSRISLLLLAFLNPGSNGHQLLRQKPHLQVSICLRGKKAFGQKNLRANRLRANHFWANHIRANRPRAKRLRGDHLCTKHNSRVVAMLKGTKAAGVT